MRSETGDKGTSMSNLEKEQILHAYLDGELDARDRLEMEESIETHPTLRAEVRFYAKMRQQLQDAPRAVASSRLESRIRGALQEEERSARWTGFWQIAMASGMACAMTALIFFWGRQRGADEFGNPPVSAEAPLATGPSSQDLPTAEPKNTSTVGTLPPSKDAPLPVLPAQSETRIPRCPRKYKQWLRQRAIEREKRRRRQALQMLRMYDPSAHKIRIHHPARLKHKLRPPQLFHAQPIPRTPR